MDKVKVINIKTGAIKEVKKSLASDYIGTQEWELYKVKEVKKTMTVDKYND